MNHDVLIMIFILATILFLLPITWLSKYQIMDDAFWKRREEAHLKRIMAMLPHSIYLWKNLLEGFQNNVSEDEKNKLAKEVSDYIKIMARV
jgi:hypothetical protein